MAPAKTVINGPKGIFAIFFFIIFFLQFNYVFVATIIIIQKNQKKYRLNAPQGNLMLTVFEAFSQFERELIVQRTKRWSAKS
ncbi:recombinase family protein [Clostridium tagluense]|uniref:recombinase family protein n=1 Tax=Clostridium tagluense TaxID=360422 RepID=UPI001C0C2DB1|nr:recombinase family protein [Clostridium tagluense]MBU3130487.1 recombinase family protein [Clostridium tagluense]